MIITQETINLLKEHNVYSASNGANRYKIGDRIDIFSNCKLELFSGMIDGNKLSSMGAFSYSWWGMR